MRVLLIVLVFLPTVLGTGCGTCYFPKLMKGIADIRNIGYGSFVADLDRSLMHVATSYPYPGKGPHKLIDYQKKTIYNFHNNTFCQVMTYDGPSFPKCVPQDFLPYKSKDTNTTTYTKVNDFSKYAYTVEEKDSLCFPQDIFISGPTTTSGDDIFDWHFIVVNVAKISDTKVLDVDTSNCH